MGKIEEFIAVMRSKPFIKSLIDNKSEIFAVGGVVRDLILNKPNKDIDLVVRNKSIDELISELEKFGRVDVVGKSFGVIKFIDSEGTDYDIALPRQDIKNDVGGYRGFDVQSDANLSIGADLSRRDAKFNAMAINLNTGKFLDPLGGLKDIENKQTSAANPQAFLDDPLRMLRMVSFSSRFGFIIEPRTMKMIQDTAERIKEITPQRILIEFDKIVKKGNKRIAAQLLKDTGLFKHIFGFDIQQSTIDRSPFEDTRTMGEFLYLLTRLLPDPATYFKTNMRGDIDTYKEIKALNMGLSNENENPIALRSVAYNMYGTSPQSLQSQILPTALRTAADELLSGKFPKTLSEMAVNGNDLLEKGLKGSEIGQVLKKMLLKVYSGKVANDKDALLALLDNNDLDEAFGRRTDDDEELERKLLIQKYDEIGEIAGYVLSVNRDGKRYLPIFINPKSLKYFEANVKALGNIKGNIYVVLENGGFIHGYIAVGAGLFGDNNGIYNNYDTYATLNRIDKTDTFEIGEMTLESAINNDAMYNVDAILDAIKQKNPQYDYLNTNREIDKIKAMSEGVGDKYAEKKFGIPDAGREFEDKYQRHRLVIDGEEPFGYVSGFIDWKGNMSPEKVPVYKNPKSLIRFDYDVRAISDNQGNLYVALVNESFNHGEMAAHIGLVGGDDTIYDRITDYLLLNRVKDKDVFGFADSSEEEYNQSNEDRKRVIELLGLVGRRNSQFKFIPKYYEEITGDKNIDESLNETIKGGTYIMYHGSDHAFNKFTDEFVGGENANDQEGAGIYFTTSEEEANRYGRYIYKVELKPRKLIDVANKRVVSATNIAKLIKMSPTWKEDVLNWDESVMRGLAEAIKGIYNYSDNEKDLYQQIEHDFFRYQPRLYVQGMTKLGFDGQYIKKDYEGITHIIVYNPEIITILESNTEQLNEEEMGRVLYSAIVLDNQSKQKLIKVFKPMIPKDWEIIAHHMTLNMGAIDKKFEQDLGRDIGLSVIDYAIDDKVMAVGVEGYPTNKGKAHITLAVNRGDGGKPMMSNNLTDWKPLDFPLKLTGTVTEVTNAPKLNENVENKKTKVNYGCLMTFLSIPNWEKITSIVKPKDLYDKKGYGIEKEPHVTILYGFHDDVDVNEVFEKYKNNQELKPIELELTGISYFETPEFDVVKFDVQSDVLTKMNKIMKSFPHTSDFPDYHPHMTIAYVKKGQGSKYVKKFEKNKKLFGNELVYTEKENSEKESSGKDGYVLNLDTSNSINESHEKSKYTNTKDALIRSKSISKEMKELIGKYLISGSEYHEGGHLYELSKPNALREKSTKANGVSMGADKNGFYVYTHRARSKSHPTPEQITIKEIEFIESTG